MKAIITTGQTTILCRRLHFNTKVVCDTALQWSLKMPHCDISLCYKNTFCIEKWLLRSPKRWYLLIPLLCHSMNLLLFPHRTGANDIYSNTTGIGNIVFSAYFCRQWNGNSQLCYQYELPFWFLDAIGESSKITMYFVFICPFIWSWCFTDWQKPMSAA